MAELATMMATWMPIDAGLGFPGINSDPETYLNGVNQGPDIPAPAETVEDPLKATWPGSRRGMF
ncbi:hypothetical protein B0J15DRAFT_505454 [Fusarium solani]|uniref:Uncharacterized protein n=1 Tax=Fusarium solani TaxID=169388 RepID=A0A9P9G5T6_FUSSL|nr:uncharacterized protein B0J15DRAFT_505454 [Fusarium solani]KAH7232532.1 hypothetical protein B0J15DRAFT_505454 [Fusarium solani]